jgi:hypothetical protein
MQPKWRRIANMGDGGNFAEYGGTLVFRDTTGEYGYEAEHWDSDDRRVYRFALDKCTYVDGILSDNPYHPNKPAWFADKLESIASTVGTTPEELIRLFCSDNPLDRAIAYDNLAANNGYFELDHYPMKLTQSEANKRYRNVKRS